MITKYLSPENLSERRLEAVRLRLDGHTVAETAVRTGLSAPTVSAAWKAFREGGWESVPVRPRGRKPGQCNSLDDAAQAVMVARLSEWPEGEAPAWSSRHLAKALAEAGHPVSARAVDHWLQARDLKPESLTTEALAHHRGSTGRWYRRRAKSVIEVVHQADGRVWLGGARVARPAEPFPGLPRYQLYLHGKRSVLYTRCLGFPPLASDYLGLFQRLLDQASGKPVALVFHGACFQFSPEVRRWLDAHPDFHLLNRPMP
ncbi:helix-turn-helix domain-containing protein [Ectothiorhodospira shaposhnikovii]|uniref:helix-turn-helix domain-containing protein n=1 Tax=Ectothiorhodospira shaposhnikovii TaxID=1054 RepID=UPI001EE7D0EE|nr:helix-turn-helix domain-containing protein [Ectothiorhodospira shaposhnikovii]MCG5513988.1 helix-turn-helix domain-containing protein [Ectothiorhodospira shaposhnikovii]